MLHILHRASACIIGAYVAVHLFNHLLAIQSVEAHIQFMKSFRHVYRNSFVEVLLLACVTFQIGSGVYFIKNRWGQRRGFFELVQALSGGYLAYFLLVHVGSVLFGRAALKLDTNFYYAAAGMHVPPFHYYFLPYYFLAIIAFFGHSACAVHWLTRKALSEPSRNYFGRAVLTAGVATAALIVAAFAGVFYDIQVPQEYRATYEFK
jgi:succinate dehydrogenase/fumarate reductase cytochrome b subunit